MLDLKVHRERWDEIHQLEREDDRKFARQLTLTKSFELFDMLCDAARPFLDDVAALIDAEREKHLVEMQRRLDKLAQWQKEHSEKAL